MEWTIPGTVLTGQREQAIWVREQFQSLFLAGGVVRSQVANLTGLEPHAVQNWVKRGFVSPPKGKRYTMRQLCRIIIINMLKNALPMERICSLLSYINGQLDDESDDCIDDAELYFAFVRVAARFTGLMNDQQALLDCIHESLADYKEPVPGAKERVEQVLAVMLFAWESCQLQKQAELLLCGLTQKGEQENG